MNRQQRYIEAALARELESVRCAGPGSRNGTLFKASAALGGLVAAGALGEDLVRSELEAAAVESGLPVREARGAIRSGLRAGKAKPRTLPEGLEGSAPGEIVRTPRTVPAPVVTPRPPAAEVQAIWARSVPVTEDAEVSAWLRSRSLDPVVVADRDLARALPSDARLPRWARCRGRPWGAGWRCLFQAWGPTGRLESLRARWVGGDSSPDGLKASAATAGTGSATGLVLADGLGRQVLESGAVSGWRPDAAFRICVCEGEADWLTWATRSWDAAEATPAVLGLWNGSWTDAIGERIPCGATVILRTHRDPQGEIYAAKVTQSLGGRCRVRRFQGSADVMP